MITFNSVIKLSVFLKMNFKCELDDGKCKNRGNEYEQLNIH